MKILINQFGKYSIILFTLFGLLGAGSIGEAWVIFFYNFMVLVSYLLLLKNTSIKKDAFYNTTNMWQTVFMYSFLMVAILNIIYYWNHGTFFAYTAHDELTYDRAAKAFNSADLASSFSALVRDRSFDDYGAILYVSAIYRIIESTLLVNFVNIICGTFSAVTLFKLGRYFLSDRFAFMASLAYFIGSFTIYFQSTGLKESVFLLIVITAFYHYYTYLVRKKLKNLFYAIFLGILIIFFRPAVLGITLVSLGVGTFLIRSGGVRSVVLSLLISIGFIYSLSTFQNVFDTFSSFDQSVALRFDDSKKTLGVTAAFLASYFGPLPTLIPVFGKEMQALYAPGLLMRVLLAAPFWLGAVLIVKQKRSLLYGILTMVLIESTALLYIMEAYELRYQIFHLPFVYLIGFYYLEQMNFFNHHRFVIQKRTLMIFSFSIILIVFYWNLRVV